MSDPQRPEREAIEQAVESALTERTIECNSVGQLVHNVTEAVLAALPPTPTPGWQPMDSAPKDRRILAVVDGIVRVVRHGKTSHVPLYGFCLADQGVEDFDLCDPTGWQDLPPAPTGERE